MSCNKNKMDENSFLTFNTSQFHSEFGNINEAGNSSACNNLLYPVNKLPEKYRHIFSNFAYFNKIQTKAINIIFHTDKSIVVFSPTGSGKTVIFELAIINFLETFEKLTCSLANSKIIYVAPIKALCSERYEDWKNKFSIYGLKCIEITGDTAFPDDKYLISNYQLIITTPEKWDSLTRKFKEFIFQICTVKLFLIDEVHLVNEGNRGATLETIINRLKIIPKINKSNNFTRFVAVSATVSNIEDIAKWLSGDQNHSAHYLKSDDDERPVKLQKIVLGYNATSGGFKFDLDLSYKLKPLIRQYSSGRPTLIFCSTRKSVELTCSILSKDFTIPLCEDKQRSINESLKEINNNKIKELVKHGIGCHHAGMLFPERSAIENLFRNGCLNILVATSTLAMGINLPAHLVIIKSTEYYTFNGYKEYNECQVLQMIGRAGRPQFDTTGTAIIMTKKSMKSRYEKILIGNQFVESHLHKYLIEHLNAEIFLGTIHDVTVATDWIRSTFLYVRACKSPQNYGMMKTHDVREIERRLQDLCLTEMKSLARIGLINFPGGNNKITSKPEGEIMAKYSISFETMKLFMHLKGTECLNDMIKLLACSKEFENIKLRRTEKVKLNILNETKLPNTAIRFPIEGGINTHETKINCLLQATLGTLKITDSSLIQDANKIILISTRLTKALREITFRGSKFQLARVACILAKCVLTKLWEQSKFVSKLIPKVGPVLSADFVLNGKTTLQSIMNTNPRDLERFLNRRPPFGNHILDFIRQIPKYKVQMSFDSYLELIILKIILIDHDNISKNVRFHTVSILVGDSENRLLTAQRIRNEELLKSEGVVKLTASLQNQFFSEKPEYTVTACLISDQWIGIDVEINLQPANHEVRTKESMSEENRVSESPLETFPTLQPIKKRTSRAVKNRTENTKIQTDIKKYLRNVSAKDQIVNKSHIEGDKDGGIAQAGADESRVATRNATGETVGTQTNRHNNGQTNEYFKFDKDDFNKYYSYDELINDDVFEDLFVPNDNSRVVSKASFDSTIDKYCSGENENRTNYLKYITRLKNVEPFGTPLRRSKYGIFNENLGNNNELTARNDEVKIDAANSAVTSVALDKPNQIVGKTMNWYCKDQAKNKENVNPLKSVNRLKTSLPFVVAQEGLDNKQPLEKSFTLTTKKCVVKRSISAGDKHLKSITPFRSTFSIWPSHWGLSDNVVVDGESNNAVTRREAKSPVEPVAPVGRLSRRIAENLDAPVNFYASQPDGFSAVHGRRDYFGATKTSRRSRSPRAGGGRRHYSTNIIDVSPGPGQSTSSSSSSARDDEKPTMFSQRFANRGHERANWDRTVGAQYSSATDTRNKRLKRTH